MIGIIGGSGFYDFLDNVEKITVSTIFGDVVVEMGKIGNDDVLFIPRHGKDHSIQPSQINYRANILAGKQLGVSSFIVSNAVGAIDKKYQIGDFVLPDQILDFTSERNSTFLDYKTQIDFDLNIAKERSEIAFPFDKNLQQQFIEITNERDFDIHNGGTLVVTQGPRFETPAEIEMYRILGADFVGMTTAPEIFLANELSIPYVSLAVITNYAAGLQSSITEEEVFELFALNIDKIKELIFEVIKGTQ